VLDRSSVSAMRRSSLLAPFQVRSFRFQYPADLLTSWGTEMENLILGWYVLVATGSVLLLTLFGSLQYFGTLGAPVLGIVGDRLGHRNMLCAMRIGYAALASIVMRSSMCCGRCTFSSSLGSPDWCGHPTSRCAVRW
jgi:MFS family permease